MEEIVEKIIMGTVQDAISDGDFSNINDKIYIKRGNLELTYTVDRKMIDNIVRKLGELDEIERDN